MSFSFRTRMFLTAVCFLTAVNLAYAEEIKLVLVGQTHAMLYPCHCPIEPDGGIARRATLLKDIAKKSPYLLLVDSGSFFAGGPMDQNTAGPELDKVRTALHMSAMERMKYDAVAVSENEFGLGRKYLEETAAKTKFPFLAANIASTAFRPFMLKKFGSATVAVIGVTDPAAQAKAEGLAISDPVAAVRATVEAVKKQGAQIVVVISGLGDEENRALLKAVPQINILIAGATYAREKVSETIDGVLVVKPRWEGRRIVTATLTVKNGLLAATKVEDLRASDKIADDKEMLGILPACFSNDRCKKEGMIGTCLNPGTSNAQCQFVEAPKLPLTVISNPDCRTCDTTGVVNSLKREFPGLSITTLNYPSDKAKSLLATVGVPYLPVYLLGKEIEKEKAFEKMKESLEQKGSWYMLKAQVAGMGFFIDRQKIADRLDVFVSLANNEAAGLLETVKEFTPAIHFLIMDDGVNFQAQGGAGEVEEALRSVCVEKYYPAFFYNYLICRAKNPQSAWWEDCLADVDTKAIRSCAKGKEGTQLLRSNISLNRELAIANGPTYLLHNQEIFGSAKTPKKEELRKIIAR